MAQQETIEVDGVTLIKTKSPVGLPTTEACKAMCVCGHTLGMHESKHYTIDGVPSWGGECDSCKVRKRPCKEFVSPPVAEVSYEPGEIIDKQPDVHIMPNHNESGVDCPACKLEAAKVQVKPSKSAESDAASAESIVTKPASPSGSVPSTRQTNAT